jgi:hypothetical protein
LDPFSRSEELIKAYLNEVWPEFLAFSIISSKSSELLKTWHPADQESIEEVSFLALCMFIPKFPSWTEEGVKVENFRSSGFSTGLSLPALDFPWISA